MPAAKRRRDEPSYIDLRTRPGRTFKTLVAGFEAELSSQLSPGDAALVRTVASLVLAVEQQQGAVAKGNTEHARDLVSAAARHDVSWRSGAPCLKWRNGT